MRLRSSSSVLLTYRRKLPGSFSLSFKFTSVLYPGGSFIDYHLFVGYYGEIVIIAPVSFPLAQNDGLDKLGDSSIGMRTLTVKQVGKLLSFMNLPDLKHENKLK